MNKDILHQPHDKFFKSTFERREVVQEYLDAFLPPVFLQKIDYKGMELDPTSYVNEALGAHYSDIVWKVPYGNKKIKIALLFEHKTAPDIYIQLQLLQYMINIWNKNISKEQPYLIPIIPIVIYQNKNKKKWEKRPLEQLFKDLDPELLPFIPCFDYILTDTSLESQAILERIQSVRALMVFKTMYQVIKELVQEKDLISFFEGITPSPDKEDDLVLFLEKRIWVYVFGNTAVKPQTILEKINILSHQKQNYMTGLESFYAESVAEGVAQGVAQGIEQGVAQGIEQGVAQGIEQGVAQGIEQGVAQGIEQGVAQGEAHGLLLTAKIIKLHTRGFDALHIAETLEAELKTVHTAIAIYEAD
jgi:predicted transposase/invertase (TIGR01784 family)